MESLQQAIDGAWEARSTLTAATAPAAVRDAVAHVIGELDGGRLRVAEKKFRASDIRRSANLLPRMPRSESSSAQWFAVDVLSPSAFAQCTSGGTK